MYVVVLWGDYTQTVPINWVDETQKILKWPPKDMQPGFAIKKKLNPGKNWEHITYTKIVYRCENFREAKKMELEATYLSTDASLHEPKNESAKRRIKKPKMDDFETNFLPVDRYVSSQNIESQDSQDSQEYEASPTIGPCESQDRQEDSSGDDHCDENEAAAGSHHSNSEFDSQEFHVEPPQKSPKLTSDSIPCPCHEGIKTVFRELSRLRRDMEDFTRRSSVATAAQSRDYSLLPRFPLTLTKQLHQFEEALLAQKTVQLQFKSKVMGIGGRDLPANLRNILKVIMTNNVATQFTWTGAKSPNMAIRGTKFITIIFEVLQVTYPQATIDTMEGITREWFRHASDRLKKQTS